MTDRDYQRSIQAPIAAAEAFDKISRVSEWWATDVTGNARKPNDTFTVRFGEAFGGTFVDFEIAEVVPDKHIEWHVTDCHLPWLTDKTEWKGTSVLWDLSSTNGTTVITMTHRGLLPEVECYDTCQKGWDFYVAESLQQFLTENKGLPNGRTG